MIKVKPKVFKTVATVLKNDKVNYAVLENGKVRMFEEVPMSAREFRNKFGDASIVKSVYKGALDSRYLYAQYVETKVRNLKLGVLLNYQKKSITASAKSMDGEKPVMKLTTRFSMESPLFHEVKDDVFSKFQEIFMQVKNYYVAAFKNNKISDVYVVRNADDKIFHPSSLYLKKDGELTELGKIWRYFQPF